KAGAWCQNAEEKDCDANFQKTPTSCEATSFCKPGCCIDTQEGICMENTPQKVCENSEGTWADDEQCNVPQCNLGCCILGEQASFVTLTRCKKLSSFYGLTTNFRRDITDENTCILITQLQDKGACVYESEYKRTCRFTTRDECSKIKPTGNVTSQSIFYKDYLCSADELATDCGPTQETICIEGKQEVYFKDSCGNPANIYDSNRINDKDYWKKIVLKSESCGSEDESGNANSRTCGNCDYYKGSICKKGSANYGEYSCSGLSCRVTINGATTTKKNGESWCEYQTNYNAVKKLQGKDLVGSRHFRHICINGEEMIEYCDDFRAKFCYEENVKISGVQFSEAACIVNRWRDCMSQDNQEDCENTDKRDCYWRPGYYFTGAGILSSTSYSSTVPAKGTGGFSGGTPVTFSAGTSSGFSGGTTGTGSVITGFATAEESTPTIQKATKSEQGACLPAITPGLRFWDSEEAASICNLGSNTCIVTCKESLIKGFSLLKEGCTPSECLDVNGEWAISMNDICTSLGDCGAYYNVVGEYTNKGAEFKKSGEKQTIGQGIYNQIKQKAGL
ncbi:MAG: hypothetical protein PHF67_02625, partial [Candidatus Nanoarchaeia archaeon]|nr:hypothetical protein [Candidatus Nanoarchaeia archaeon]